MPAPITIIIPTLNSAQTLPATFAALVEGLQADLIAQVIVVDGGSQDATVDIAAEWGATVLHAPPSRGGQLAVGGQAARGDWLLFLHSDTQLSPGWSQAVVGLTPDRAFCFCLKFRAAGFAARWVAGWANLRTRLFGLPYGDQGMLLHRNLYDAVGGYPNIKLMEDVALARALPHKPILLPAFALTDARKFETQGWLRRGARNLGLLARYFMGTSPDDLAKRY